MPRPPDTIEQVMQAPVTPLTPTTPLKTALEALRASALRALPVTERGALVGLLGDDVQLPQGARTVGEAMRPCPAALRGPDPVELGARALLDTRAAALPVLNEAGTPIGMLDACGVLRALDARAVLAHGLVRQHMSRAPTAVAADLPAAEAAARVVQSGHPVLPVLRGGVLAGVLRREDLLGERLDGRTAADLMRAPAHHIDDLAPLHTAVRNMVRSGVHGLPVIDGDGALLGVLTARDVQRASLGRPRPAPGAGAGPATGARGR